MKSIDIYDLQAFQNILWLYRLLEDNQQCLVTDEDVPIALITPLSFTDGAVVHKVVELEKKFYNAESFCSPEASSLTT